MFKIDDTLVSLINDYHGVEHSDIISYFGALCESSLKCEANIINDKKKD
jgi:predicted regulator of Ras-like GTPase activity (Roadblock/LC7/MglB family)